jgi:hypothetical protein
MTATMTPVKTDAQYAADGIAAWTKAYADHQARTPIHPMCLVCTEIEESIRTFRQNARLAAAGRPLLPRYIACLSINR